jgi:hypothetical protein
MPSLRNKQIFIPSIDPLNNIERKSPVLSKQLMLCEKALDEGRRHNGEEVNVPWILMPLVWLFRPLNIRQKDYQQGVDNAHNAFVRIRATFHETLEKHNDCYHQVLAYDREIEKDPTLSACKEQLDRLWDMFAHGDVYFKNQFMSYFGEYKIELDSAIETMKAS